MRPVFSISVLTALHGPITPQADASAAMRPMDLGVLVETLVTDTNRFTADELWSSSNRAVSVGAATPVTTNASVCSRPVDDRCFVRHAMCEVRRSSGCAQCPPFTMATVRPRGAAVFAGAVTAGATECRVCGDGVVCQ